MVTVCDMAREELGGQAAVHWSVPDPVPAGDPASFDAAVADLSDRVGRLAPRLAATSDLPGGHRPARMLRTPGERSGLVRAVVVAVPDELVDACWRRSPGLMDVPS